MQRAQSDRQRRVHRFRDVARRVIAQLSADDRALLTAYSEGANAGLSALTGAPIEYLILRTDVGPTLQFEGPLWRLVKERLRARFKRTSFRTSRRPQALLWESTTPTQAGRDERPDPAPRHDALMQLRNHRRGRRSTTSAGVQWRPRRRLFGYRRSNAAAITSTSASSSIS
jgi:acyl-homoserine lactone acylase PvdQ